MFPLGLLYLYVRTGLKIYKTATVYPENTKKQRKDTAGSIQLFGKFSENLEVRTFGVKEQISW